MNSYKFVQQCKPKGDFRIKLIIEWLKLMKQAFGISSIYEKDGKQIIDDENYFQNMFERKRNKIFLQLGANIDLFSIPPKERNENTMCFEITSGIHFGEIFNDKFAVDINPFLPAPDLVYFKRSIEIFKPFEAYLAEYGNEIAMNSFDRFQQNPKIPSIIRGFHYLDESMAETIGGIEKCLEVPAWKVERFCDGVLIQITEGLFDTTDPAHLEAQKRAMKHFRMD